MFARLALGLMICLPGAALAQTAPVLPALPDSSIVAVCSAGAPAAGAGFSGPVMQVMDGDILCVAAGPTPDQWIAVRPVGVAPAAALPQPQARSLLMAATFSRRLDCVAGDQVGAAVAAVCTVEGQPLIEELKAARSRPDWGAWR